jgi:calcineurin-like phosphoesterase family protein
MTIYFSSDHHFHHFRICEYCNRPFSEIDEMNSVLISKWNSIVKPEDHVYYLGDFGLCGPEKLMPIRKSLNGIWKLFLAGNHDRNSMIQIPELAERIVKYNKTQRYEIELEGIPFVMSHVPIPNAGKDERVYLFGHIHSKVPKENPFVNSIHIGCDSWDYGPVSIEQIKKLL